eukprot:scaffold103466_cov54-Phaeocystis_antarctica.AAC.5
MPRFASIEAAASSWRLGWRDHEAAWSRRPSRWWQQASRVAAAQTAQGLLPEAWDCRRQVRSGRSGGPTTAWSSVVRFPDRPRCLPLALTRTLPDRNPYPINPNPDPSRL